ncbi:hypothetical protein [Salinilacihabitans rarus]|uniref:hypothetical protein n=1 Tax=Salinilacihabitans rarus TaxID=2961596 RepID=UPI0020C877F9|nr:hypothetical protein [Salinilacihabitans rarus]
MQFDDADIRTTVEAWAESCADCRVVTHELTHATATEYDLCEEHHREAIERRHERETAETGEGLSIRQRDQEALASFGVEAADTVTDAILSAVDPASVAAAVADDPTDGDAVRTLGVLARLDPERISDASAAVDACLSVVVDSEWDGRAVGARTVLEAVAPVDRSVARRLIDAVTDPDPTYRATRALAAVVENDPETILAVESGVSSLADVVVTRGRAGSSSSSVFRIALQVARADPTAFRGSVDAFAPLLDGADGGSDSAFLAAATLGRVASADANAVDEYRGILLDWAHTEAVAPRREMRHRTAAAVAFAHSPALAAGAGVDRDWLRERLRPALQRKPVVDERRAEVVRALGRFVPVEDDPDPAGDRAFLEWIARVHDGRVETAARRALDGAFRVGWPTGSTSTGPGATADADGRTGSVYGRLAARLADRDVPLSFVVATGTLEELGVDVEDDAVEWDADELRPFAHLTAHHEVGVADLHEALSLNAVVICIGLQHFRYEPERYPFPVYGFDSDRPTLYATPEGLLVAPRVDDREAVEETFREIVEELAAADVVEGADATVEVSRVGDLFEGE